MATDASNNTTTQAFTVTVNNGDTVTLAYDDNGNLTQKVVDPGGAGEETWSYGWDGINRLIWVLEGDAGSLANGMERKVFTYDGYDRRVKWEEHTYNSATSAWDTNTGVDAVKKFVWYGTEICQQRDASNGRWKHFYADGEHDVTASGGSGTKRYYTWDHLGSVRETVDENGDVVNQYDYSPYGVRETLVDGGEECLFGFTGHVFDDFSGLHLALYRGYDAELGRWVSRDPIALVFGQHPELLEEGINLYGYVGGNVGNDVDLMGLSGTPAQIAVAVANAVRAGNIKALEILAAGGGLCPAAFRAASARANQINHIFNNMAHNLSGLVNRFFGGDNIRALRAMEQAIKKMMEKKEMLGRFTESCIINGETVILKRFVRANGTIDIATAYIRTP